MKNEVESFLSENKIPKKQTKKTLQNACLLYLLWAVSFSLYLYLGQLHPLWAVTFAIIWSAVMLPIQMAVMHDASHSASSENAQINTLLALSISFLGGSALLWKKQHCQAHHSFTNIHGLDHDIHTGGILRLHPSQPLKPAHQYQKYYAWLLYPLFVLSWVWWGDFRDLKDNTYSLTRRQWTDALIETILVKIWHVALFIALPIFIFDSLSLAIFCYILSFSILGFIMVVVFQLAHISSRQQLAKLR